jgi:phosphoribosylanthranilate isomerase
MSGIRIKVCGVTCGDDVEALAAGGVHFAGLWHGVRGGRADLPRATWRDLARSAHRSGVEPVLVTFSSAPKRLRDLIVAARVRWVQLHGLQTPAVVRALKRGAPEGTRIIKALHVRGQDCLERPLVAAYERAGVDVFLLDAATHDGRLGSTGQTLHATVAADLADELSRPFMLAGGLGALSWREYPDTIRHSRFFGIDIDTSVRAADGAIDRGRVAALTDAWNALDLDLHGRAQLLPD